MILFALALLGLWSMQKKKKRETNMERLSLKTTDVARQHNRTSIYSETKAEKSEKLEV